MLQIKKLGTLFTCKYNLYFLFRRKTDSTQFPVKKQISQTISLRSPKHFNIGKYKILSLNYKTPRFVVSVGRRMHLNTLFRVDYVAYSILSKRLKLNPTIGLNSLRITFKTKFKLMWLEI